jgi:hypothetical protein
MNLFRKALTVGTILAVVGTAMSMSTVPAAARHGGHGYGYGHRFGHGYGRGFGYDRFDRFHRRYGFDRYGYGHRFHHRHFDRFGGIDTRFATAAGEIVSPA